MLAACLTAVATGAAEPRTPSGKEVRRAERRLLAEADSLSGIELNTKVPDKPMFPVFGPFRDNYIVLGSNTYHIPSANTIDIKFQVSFALRLWHMPRHNVDVLFTYTQRCFWDAFRYSSPFRENDFNPGIWFAWRVRHDTTLLFGFEHESNGRDSEDSRSWNYASAACIWDPLPNWRFGAHLWYGYYDRLRNPDWWYYRGLGRVWATYHTRNERIAASVSLNPTEWMRNCNVQAEFSWKMARRGSFIPRLFVQYHYGYNDGMLRYNRLSSVLRVGVSFSNNRLTMF